MVDRRVAIDLDTICQPLSRPTRRVQIEDLATGPASVTELAESRDICLAAVSKHLQVLENAGLIEVEQDGRVRQCQLEATPLSVAFGWLTQYRVFWDDRLDALADHLENEGQ
ncbi:metalloregulator ArsR/SmtB family transcription factor [Natrialba sp. PRR66]|uniref:ArsR/SmtB family transcription factor n=1 Tax=Natrialba sp. PRR66 TaxID=3098146 RepID=UPI002B1E34A0|nr:metalloregulator ArsR/SmtB family transcription factor [Natrialba sp. PRR66]